MKRIDIETLDYKEILKGSSDFIQNEKRDAIYKVTAF